MSTRVLLPFVFFAVLVVPAVAAAQRPGAALDCAAAKGVAAGQYAACLHKAEARLLRTVGICSASAATACFGDADCPPGDICNKDLAPGSRHADDTGRCAARFDDRWHKLDRKAAPLPCPDGLGPEEVRSAVAGSVAEVNRALAGHGWSDCAAVLVQCSADLSRSDADRDACVSDFGRAREELANCNDGAAGCVAGDDPGCLPPPAPTGLVAVPADGSVRLAWAGAGAIHLVERGPGPGGPFSVIGRTVSAAFIDADATNGTTYWYVVSALRQGLASARSGAVAATPLAPPQVPSPPEAGVGDGRVTLRWTRAPGATQTRVLRAAAENGSYAAIAITEEESFVDTDVVNGASYWYALVALNPVAESTPGPAVRAIPVAAPAGVQAVAADGQVALFWRVSAGAETYAVERASGAAGPWEVIGGPGVPRFVDTALENGIVRFYRIVARTAVGPGEASEVVAATPAADALALPPADDPTRNQAGMNVWFNQDWDGTGAFVDVMKQSRPWQDGANWHEPVRGVDALGWPTADASTVVFSGAPADFNGTYRLVFEGRATVSPMWSPGSVTNQVYDEATNTTTADVTFAMVAQGSVGLVFRDTRRTAASPVGSGFANVRLYRPGYPADGSVVFTAPFLAALGKAGTVRLMDWAETNNNVVVRWADRVTPRHATQGGLIGPAYTAPDGAVYARTLGVALEHQIQLCNELMVDCWLNVPPVADDEFVHHMALAIRFGTDGSVPYTSPQEAPVFPPLHPALRLYVEYGNENWNSGSGFLGFHLIRAICAHLPADHPVMLPAPDSIYTAVWRYPAWRTWAVSEAFRAVFGDAAMMTRVRPVLMTQRGNGNNTLGAALTWLDGFLASRPESRAMNDVLFGAGGSGYYGVNAAVSADPDRFFAPGNYPDNLSLRDFGRDATWCRNYGLQRVAYEGGPGLSYTAGDNRSLNADPRMQDMVEAAHDAWTAAGGDLLVYYVLRGPTEWEFTPRIGDADTPKLRGLAAIQSRPRVPVTLGDSLPGSIVARGPNAKFVNTSSGYDLTIDGRVCAANHTVGTYTAHAGHAPAAYAGELGVTGHSYLDTRVAVWINGERRGEIFLPGVAGDRRLYASTTLPVDVPAGLVVVRLEVLEGNLTLYAIELPAAGAAG